MAAKKTLYEVLDIPRDASAQDIGAAHRRKLAALQAEQACLDRTEFDYRRTVLKVASETLSDPAARRSYDDRLLAESVAASAAAAANAPQERALAAVPPDILARRAEALSLRADALSLRADAISIQTDAALLPEESTASLLSRIWARATAASRSAWRILGVVVLVLVVLQGTSMFFATRAARVEDARSDEKIVIQEYYQTYGVRPASAAEARALMAEHERKDREEREAEREKREAERERRKIEDQERRFKEESRHVGDQVSADLQRAEERQRREREYAKAREEAEERRRAAAEEQRLQRDQEEWQKVLAR